MYTEIDPDDHLVVALKLSKERGGDAYVRILSAARRCLKDFTLKLPGTDYYLLLESELSEFTECLLQGSFEGVYDHRHIQVFSAWPRDHYSQHLYEQTQAVAQAYVAEELTRVAEYLPTGKRVTKATYKESLYRVRKLQRHFNNDTLVEVGQFLTLLSTSKIEGRRRKVAKHLKRLAENLTSV